MRVITPSDGKPNWLHHRSCALAVAGRRDTRDILMKQMKACGGTEASTAQKRIVHKFPTISSAKVIKAPEKPGSGFRTRNGRLHDLQGTFSTGTGETGL